MNQQVFLVGAPRSGGGLFLDLMTSHPAFGWISNKLDARPDNLRAAAKNRRFDWPLLGEYWFERRFWVKHLPHPSPGDRFWEHWLPPFHVAGDAPRIPGPEDLSDETAAACAGAVDEILLLQNRDRFVAQYSGWPRVAFFRKVFPAAKFIQLQRDPRSVAYRLAQTWKAAGERNPPEPTPWSEREAWRALMPETLRTRLASLPDTPLNFAGVYVRWLHESYKSEFHALPETDWLSLAYADLLAHPEKTMNRALDFLGLPPSKRMRRYVKYHQIRDKNQRLRKDLSETAAAQLEDAVKKISAPSA